LATRERIPARSYAVGQAGRLRRIVNFSSNTQSPGAGTLFLPPAQQRTNVGASALHVFEPSPATLGVEVAGNNPVTQIGFVSYYGRFIMPLARLPKCPDLAQSSPAENDGTNPSGPVKFRRGGVPEPARDHPGRG
jgi:hypothetical protein